MIKYKGYTGQFSFNENTNLFQGYIANVHDVVTFQGASVVATEQAFREAVDDYLEWRQKYGKEPDKALP